MWAPVIKIWQIIASRLMEIQRFVSKVPRGRVCDNRLKCRSKELRQSSTSTVWTVSLYQSDDCSKPAQRSTFCPIPVGPVPKCSGRSDIKKLHGGSTSNLCNFNSAETGKGPNRSTPHAWPTLRITVIDKTDCFLFNLKTDS